MEKDHFPLSHCTTFLTFVTPVTISQSLTEHNLQLKPNGTKAYRTVERVFTTAEKVAINSVFGSISSHRRLSSTLHLNVFRSIVSKTESKFLTTNRQINEIARRKLLSMLKN
jgi:hypothetical protein